MAKDEKVGTKKSRKERNKLKVKPPTKIVIRHLPPTMTEEEFLKQIDPLPEHDFYYFSAADWSLGFDATCRAYIAFKNYEDVFLFRDRFDGYVFVDNKGNEYAAIVEFAPFQGFLKNKSRNSDNKVNTIEQEPHYEQFLKKLEEEREATAKGGESKLEFSLDSKKEEITSTPLLQYLASKKEKRREESKKRTAEKKKRREEEKEKRKQTPAPAPTQPVKVLTADYNNKGEKVEPKGTQAREEPKNARLRRREERNRLRHEAYLQRKKALKDQQNNKDADTPSSEKDDPIQVKKEDATNQEKSKDTSSHSADVQKPIEILKKTKPADLLTESVRNFIFGAPTSLTSAAATSDSQSSEAKENGTKSKEDNEKLQKNASKLETNASEGLKQELEDQEKLKEAQKEASSKINNGEVKKDFDKLEETVPKLDLNPESNGGTSGESKQESRNQEKLTEKQREERREERRIRNKDRPSIAIYQPKPRMRLSEESDSNSTSTKDVRSLSVSDCEASAKKEEPQRQKRVQRYSERSKNRRKSLPKEGAAADEENKGT